MEKFDCHKPNYISLKMLNNEKKRCRENEAKLTKDDAQIIKWWQDFCGLGPHPTSYK